MSDEKLPEAISSISLAPVQKRTPKMSDDRILVIVDKPLDQIMGIILPDESRDTATTGVIKNRGPLSKYETDESIMFSQYAGVDVVLDGDKYKCLHDSDVVAVLSPTPNNAGRIGYKPTYVKASE